MSSRSITTVDYTITASRRQFLPALGRQAAITSDSIIPRQILSGRVALVTGGSRGIGAAIAKRLGQEGATVAITYASSKEKARSVARSSEAFGVRALTIRADARGADAVRQAVRTTVEKLGSL